MDAQAWKLVAIGLGAGAGSGIFGIGGGIVMVPLLVLACRFEQHDAHVTSLGAGMILAVSGAATYAVNGRVSVVVGACLAAGALVGAPLGASLMNRLAEAPLKAAFGALLIVVAIFQFVQ
ncbi:MAG TPA: sulfite exporter TauE/SafE family protein [Actinomycetota bacterium]|nr:sulfite exporter TauE/SafE family protein [Actinomycetota bacterium]